MIDKIKTWCIISIIICVNAKIHTTPYKSTEIHAQKATMHEPTMQMTSILSSRAFINYKDYLLFLINVSKKK